MIDYGHDLQYTKLLPEFAKLQAILGRRLRDTDSWAPYARLVALHGWKRLIRAAEQADPDKRWPSDLERLCNQYAKDEADAEVEERRRVEIAALPKPTNGPARAALFREILEKKGLR